MIQVITKLNSGVSTFVKAGTIQDDAKPEQRLFRKEIPQQHLSSWETTVKVIIVHLLNKTMHWVHQGSLPPKKTKTQSLTKGSTTDTE